MGEIGQYASQDYDKI